MSILVTGGTGYIGSHTCVELMDMGEDVIIYDNFCNSKPQIADRIRTITGKNPMLIEGDILDIERLRSTFTAHKIDAVIHFAGLKAVGESTIIPMDYYNNNVTGALNLVRVMDEAGCKTIVFSSSATVYGIKAPFPYKETMALTPTSSPYGATKVFIERILQDICASDNEWSAVLLRYFNPIGAHESGLIGENPRGIPNNLMPYIGKVALGELPFLRVFGNDYNTPDGTCIRDYLHVVDLALGHCAALDYAQKHRGTEIVNLGSGHGYSVLEIIFAFEKASGVKIPYEIAPRRSGDLDEFYANAEKARELFGWQTQRSIDDMCKDTWKFIQKSEGNL
jgi:UDP-glucose 4-epimerase